MQAAMFKGYPRYTQTTTFGGRVIWRDNKERIDFDRSKYIPGNGPHQRLGKRIGR